MQLIRQTLTDDTYHRNVGSLAIIHAVRDPVVIPELIFRQIAMQMLFTAMLIDALHAAFEDTEIAFDGVAVARAVGAIDILARAVRRGAVHSAMQLHVAIAAMFVSHHSRFAGDVLDAHRPKPLGAGIVANHP